jgi:PleD family two-component response regulator
MSNLAVRLQQELDRMKPASILIVEPDPAIAGLLSDHLRHYKTQIAGNGRDAQTLCQQTPPNLILIDTSLPDTSALNLFQQFLPLKFINQIPIFFLGQLDDTREQRMKALEMGVDDYICKPFDVVELKFRVKNALPDPNQSVDLVTGLPGWPAVHHDLQWRLRRPDWSLILINIAYMPAYHDLYGTIAGQRVRRSIAGLLNDVVDSLGQADDFIGALSEQEFVIITGSEQHGRMLNLFQQRFTFASREWYSPQEIADGRVQLLDGSQLPLMSPTTAVITASPLLSTPLAIIEAAETLRQQQHPAAPVVTPFKAIFATS